MSDTLSLLSIHPDSFKSFPSFFHISFNKCSIQALFQLVNAEFIQVWTEAPLHSPGVATLVLVIMLKSPIDGQLDKFLRHSLIP